MWQNAQPRRVPARTQLVRQGSIGWQVPLLLSGYVRLSEITEFGDERLLDVVMAGECPLVLDALLERSPTASAETMGECVIAQLSPLAIQDAVRLRPELWRDLTELAAAGWRRTRSQASLLRASTVPCRLSGTLLLLADRFSPHDGVLPAEITRHELARLAGTRPETVVRLIGRWTHAGILEKLGRQLVLLDRDALGRLAAGTDEAN